MGKTLMLKVHARLSRSCYDEFPLLWQRVVLARLVELGIAPFTMVSVEHMLCEFRKLAAEKKSADPAELKLKEIAGLIENWAPTRDHVHRLREAWARSASSGTTSAARGSQK